MSGMAGLRHSGNDFVNDSGEIVDIDTLPPCTCHAEPGTECNTVTLGGRHFHQGCNKPLVCVTCNDDLNKEIYKDLLPALVHGERLKKGNRGKPLFWQCGCCRIHSTNSKMGKQHARWNRKAGTCARKRPKEFRAVTTATPAAAASATTDVPLCNTVEIQQKLARCEAGGKLTVGGGEGSEGVWPINEVISACLDASVGCPAAPAAAVVVVAAAAAAVAAVATAAAAAAAAAGADEQALSYLTFGNKDDESNAPCGPACPIKVEIGIHPCIDWLILSAYAEDEYGAETPDFVKVERDRDTATGTAACKLERVEDEARRIAAGATPTHRVNPMLSPATVSHRVNPRQSPATVCSGGALAKALELVRQLQELTPQLKPHELPQLAFALYRAHAFDTEGEPISTGGEHCDEADTGAGLEQQLAAAAAATNTGGRSIKAEWQAVKAEVNDVGHTPVQPQPLAPGAGEGGGAVGQHQTQQTTLKRQASGNSLGGAATQHAASAESDRAGVRPLKSTRHIPLMVSAVEGGEPAPTRRSPHCRG